MYYDNRELVDFSELEGKTLIEITREREGERASYDSEGETLSFFTDDGEEYQMHHDQDCCEHVTIEDIDGDLGDLLNTPILRAVENSRRNKDGNWGDSETWTFYNMSTIKGSVTIRWYGTSNGYYSESVYLYRIKK